MSKQPRVATHPDTLKPIIEAMIFASEEPLSARALLRLLAGDRENERPDGGAAEPAETPVPVETSGDLVTGLEVDTEPVKEHGVETSVEQVEAAPEEAGSEEPASEEPDAGEPADLKSVSEEPADEEPADEEPADAEPVTEELAAEEPVNEGSATEEPVDAEPASEATAGEETSGEEEAPAGEDAPATVASADEPRSGGVMDSSFPAVGTIEFAPEIDHQEEELIPDLEMLEISESLLPPADQLFADNDEPFADELLANDTPADDPAADEDVAELAGAMERAGRRQSRPEGWEVPDILDQAYLRHLIDELNDEYEESGRVFRIVEVAGGFQFATIREFGEFVAMLSKDKSRRRLSPAALETLAIIAYRQPVSKPEVEAIRGVNCDQVLLSLMEKTLIAITGRSEGVGRPLLYGTTEEFLRIFGLKGLGDLPKLREIEELMEEDAYTAEKAEVITVDADTDVEEIEAKVGAAGHLGEHGDDGLPVGLDGRGDEGGTESEEQEETGMEDSTEPGSPEMEASGTGEPEIGESESGESAPERPEVETPEVERPEVEQPEVEQPEVEQPEIEQPEIERPEIDEPEIEQPEVEEPEIERPEIDEPEIEEPEIEHPEIDEPHPANGAVEAHEEEDHEEEDHEEEGNGEMARDARAA